MPLDSRRAVIMSLCKRKESRMERGNHKAISLLSSVGMLCGRKVIERVRIKTKDDERSGACIRLFQMRMITE